MMPTSVQPVPLHSCSAMGTVEMPAAAFRKIDLPQGRPGPELVGVEGVDAVVLGCDIDHVCALPMPGKITFGTYKGWATTIPSTG